jgi:extracellular matrix regulatory protein A
VLLLHRIIYNRLRLQPGTRERETHMDQNLLNIGFGNTVVAERVVAIVSPNSAPMKRLKDEAKDEKRLIDATHGRRTRSIIIMDSNHIVLSAIQAETISQRYTTLKGSA